jgi:F-type H+-transporting ATPase subunit delta
MSHIGLQYAEALFSLAFEQDKVEAVWSVYDTFLRRLQDEDRRFFLHPKVRSVDKKDVIGQLGLDEPFTSFLYVLIDNGRFDLLEDIAQELRTIIDSQQQLMRVTVYSKRELSQTEQDRLIEQLTTKHNRRIELEHRIDPTILGGIRLEYDGHVWDGTINHRLREMQSQLRKQ